MRRSVRTTASLPLWRNTARGARHALWPRCGRLLLAGHGAASPLGSPSAGRTFPRHCAVVTGPRHVARCRLPSVEEFESQASDARVRAKRSRRTDDLADDARSRRKRARRPCPQPVRVDGVTHLGSRAVSCWQTGPENTRAEGRMRGSNTSKGFPVDTFYFACSAKI